MINLMIETEEKLKEYRETIRRFHEKIPVDITNLCNELGASVRVINGMPDDLSGFILKENDEFKIFINEDEPPTRQRFTIAHELSHYLLHKDNLNNEYPENILLRGGLSNKEETEANMLAAELLMPYESIFKYIDARDGTFAIPSLAGHFDVSKQAMSIRLGIPMDI